MFAFYQRKTKIESSSAAQPALHTDAAPPGLHNTIAHGKSQPCSPSLFGGKERTKDTEQRLRADTRAGIGYCDGQLAAAPCRRGLGSRSDFQRSSHGHGIYGVKKDIDQNLFQMLWIAANAGQIRRNIDVCQHVGFIEIASNQLDAILNDGINDDRNRLVASRAGKIEEVFYNVSTAVGFILNDSSLPVSCEKSFLRESSFAQTRE